MLVVNSVDYGYFFIDCIGWIRCLGLFWVCGYSSWFTFGYCLIGWIAVCWVIVCRFCLGVLCCDVFLDIVVLHV